MAFTDGRKTEKHWTLARVFLKIGSWGKILFGEKEIFLFTITQVATGSCSVNSLREDVIHPVNLPPKMTY